MIAQIAINRPCESIGGLRHGPRDLVNDRREQVVDGPEAERGDHEIEEGGEERHARIRNREAFAAMGDKNLPPIDGQPGDHRRARRAGLKARA